MYKVIMAPTEGSESEKGALSVAVKLARRFGADLHLVRVESCPLIIDPVSDRQMLMVSGQAFEEDRLTRVRKLEALGAECCQLSEVNVVTALKEGPVGSTLRDYAKNLNVDLIVMSSHSRGGLKRVALGSVTDYLIRHSNIPVLVVKQPAAFIGAVTGEVISQIVVPLDGSSLAGQILQTVADLALTLNARVSLLRVVTPQTYSQKQIMQPGLPWWDADIARADAYITGAAEYLTKEGVSVTTGVVVSDDVAAAILDYSDRAEADLIALATSGTGGISRLIFGSVADELARKSPRSLLVFHPRPSPVTDTTNDLVDCQVLENT
jgi:nucleotide-binding universal stress UspA family protein